VPPIPSSEEMLEMAFRRATKEGNKAYSGAGSQVARIKRAERARVKTAGRTVMDHFKRILNRTPRLEELSPFYRELICTVVDRERFKRSLASMKWVSEQVKRLVGIYSGRIGRSRTEGEIKAQRREFYGRLASLLRQIEPHLDYLRDARERLKDLPKIEDDVFTVVIAGPPNVGKSTLLSAMTSATPRVESYPFTTQGILLGYFEDNYQRYQIVDTPGLLDRPLAERNPAERHAVLALKHLADAVAYVFDPTLSCGFSRQAQENIYREIKERFPVPVLPVLNKMDLVSGEATGTFLKGLGQSAYMVSAKEGTGIDELKEKIMELKRIKDLEVSEG